MTLLLTSDLHLTDAPRDAYRFNLFPWMAKQQITHKTKATFILGDLTNDKDRHSSVLVNKLVDGLKKLKPPIYILKGNHDYIREDLPFFQFLNAIDGIKFCTELTLIEDLQIVMMPHQLNQAALDNALKRVPDRWLVMMHQTLTGAISETGARLTGLVVPSNCKAKALFSGDVHVPHNIKYNRSDGQYNVVTYIGSPYHVRFGDQFSPRVILLDGNGCDKLHNGGRQTDLYFQAPRKLSISIRDLAEMPELKKGDQVKVTLELPRSEAVEWANHKKSIIDYCKDKGIEVYGTELRVAQARKRQRLDDTPTNRSNLDYFKTFCLSEGIPIQMQKIGLELMK